MKKTVFAFLALLTAASLLFAFAASAGILGDFDCNGNVTSDDAIYLLRYTLFPESYSVSGYADFNGDGKITSDDAIYLLRYTLFPTNYPLISQACEHPAESVVTDAAVSATCTETGLTEGSHCSACGEILVAQNTIPALEHEWKEGVCTRCGEKLCSKGLEYVRDGSYYKVAGIGNCMDTDLYIPAEYNGLPVLGIASYAFSNNLGIKNVYIHKGALVIDQCAFRGCISLTSITIPDSVTSIGSYAFSGCSGLTSITIPDSVMSIGLGAFNGCTGLESLTLPFVGGSASNNTYLSYIFGANSYSSNPDYVPSSLKDVIISNKCTSISSDAFYYCSSLTSVIIPDSVTSIGKSAFYNCSRLTSITIPDSVTSIGNFAFYDCTSLTSVTILDSVTSIGSSTFHGCDNLTIKWIITDLATFCSRSHNFGSKAELYMNGSLITDLSIPDSVTSIGNYALSGCTSLKSVIIPDSVTSIGLGSFNGCTGLESLTLPFVGGSRTENTFLGYIFGTSSYSYNSKYVPSSLKNVILSDACETIPGDAFNGCISLTSVIIPASVTRIYYRAFSGCTSLASVTFHDSMPPTASDAFNSVHDLTIKWIITDLAKFCKYSHNYGTNQEYYMNGSLVTDLVIPDSVTSISSYAFSGCTSLVSVTIPDSVTWINESAFYGCTGLAGVTIGNSVKSIGERAFKNCTGLTSVTIPDSVTSIGISAFSGCSSLTSITIPGSVTSIGDWAFYDCSSLTEINFTGTKAWWNIIGKGYYWNNNTGSYVVHCTDGDIAK